MATPVIERSAGDLIDAQNLNDIKDYIEDGTYRINTKSLNIQGVGEVISSTGAWLGEPDSTPLTVAGMNTIRQLQDRAISFSANGSEGWGDAYIDATGRLNSVDTGNTEANFDIDKYKSSDYSLGTDSYGQTGYTNNANSVTMTVTCNTKGYFTNVCTNSASTGSFTFTVTDGDTNVLVSRSCTAREDNTILPSEYTRAIAADETVTVTLLEGSSNNIYYNTAGVYSGTYMSIAAGNHNTRHIYGTSSLQYTAYSDLATFEVAHNIPSGTFTDTISSCFGTVLVEDWEAGANIQYKLTGTGGTEDTGWLDIDTVSTFTAFTAEPDTMIIALTPKTVSPTDGYPSVNGYWITEY